MEVKIITTGYYDNDDDSVHLLSDEESQTFNKMIVTILVSDSHLTAKLSNYFFYLRLEAVSRWSDLQLGD